MRRALLVSYYFPPRFAVGGKRAHRFARYLPDSGWQTTVLTARAPGGERLDPSFDDASLANCRVDRGYLADSEIAQLSSHGGDTDGTISGPTKPWTRARPASMWARLRRELRPHPLVGPQMRFIPAIASRIAHAARDADVVFATGSPWETVVAATIGARRAGKPLVVDFRDPWSFGPVRQRKPRWLAATDDIIEHMVLRSARAVTVTTETTRDAYARRTHAQKVHCVRNGFDPAMQPKPQRQPRATLIHFGSCYGERNLSPYLRALAQVVDRRALTTRDIQLMNLGRVSQRDVELAEELGIADYFTYRPVLPYPEGMALVAGADLALLPRFGTAPWFIPGKFYDYLLARTPILAIASSPELDGLVAGCRAGFCHDYDDVGGLAQRIEQALEARRANRPLVTHDDISVSALSARAATRKLAAVFEEVTRRG